MQRRSIQFDSLAAVLSEAEALLEHGYQRAGNWSLGTMGNHLGRAMKYSRDGFPSLWPRPFQAVLRAMSLKSILERQRFRFRFPAPISVANDATDEEGVQCLREGIARFEAPDGEYRPHIVLGKMTPAEWRQFHLWHCEHHFSYLIPNGVGAKQV